MIDISGIKHYPRQRKKGGGFKLWILTATLVVIVAVYYYLFDDKQQTPTKPKTSLIIVKEPEIIAQTKTQVISKAITQPETQTNEVLENLDEIKSAVQ